MEWYRLRLSSFRKFDKFGQFGSQNTPQNPAYFLMLLVDRANKQENVAYLQPSTPYSVHKRRISKF